MTKYTYSIQNDITAQLVDADRLTQEIRASAIVTSLNHIDTGGDVLDIWFNADLSGADETILDGIVLAHSGESLTQAPQEVSISQADTNGNITVATQPRTGTGLTLITHNFADPKSWYSNSTRVLSGVISASGEAYTHYNFSGEVIDMENGRVTFEDKITNPLYDNETYVPKIQVNGSLVTSGYAINYITNQVIFTTPLTANDVVTSTYYQVNDSVFIIKPYAGKELIMEHVEVQFSKNVDFASKQLWFDIWAYNPYDPYGPKIRADVPAIYKNVKDFLNESNNSLGVMVPAIGELTKDCYIFVWQYPAARIIKSSQGVEIRIHTFNPANGSKSEVNSSIDSDPVEVATATFYCLSQDEQ